MYESSSIMVLKANAKTDEVYRIEVDADTQKML